jgi:hypothetical protein
MWTIKRLSIMDDMPVLVKDGQGILMIPEEHFNDFAELIAKAAAYDKYMAKSEPPTNGSNIAINAINDMFSHLEYGSYSANRGYGMTHEQLLSIGIGNDEMKAKYEQQQPEKP